MREQVSLKAKLFLAALLLVSVAGIESCKPKAAEAPVAGSLTISMSDFISKVEANSKSQILDVRTSAEYAEGHVPGAKLLPLAEIEAGAAVPFEKDSEILVICRSGKRSLQATQILRSNGYARAVSVDGGTMAWIGSGKPVEK